MSRIVSRLNLSCRHFAKTYEHKAALIPIQRQGCEYSPSSLAALGTAQGPSLALSAANLTLFSCPPALSQCSARFLHLDHEHLDRVLALLKDSQYTVPSQCYRHLLVSIPSCVSICVILSAPEWLGVHLCKPQIPNHPSLVTTTKKSPASTVNPVPYTFILQTLLLPWLSAVFHFPPSFPSPASVLTLPPRSPSR